MELKFTMKRISTILIFSILFTFQCLGQQSITDMILLIDYSESKSCKVIEIDGKKTDPEKHLCLESYIDVDDFSEYFPIKKVFHYDGEIELASNDKILLWDYYYKKTIDSLPFSYSKVKIIAMSKDSILKIQLNGKMLELLPGVCVTDTTIQTKKETNKIVRYTTVTSIENLGLIEKRNVIDNKHWKTRSLELALDAPTFAEVMPEFVGGHSEFLNYLTSKMNYPVRYTSMKNSKLVIEFIIDETGEVTMTRILRSIDPAFDNQVHKLLKKMPKWKPGMNDGKPVPVKMTVPVYIELNE